MKKILLHILPLMFVQLSLAQIPGVAIPQAGDNVLDTALNKFAGSWRWTSGTDTVILVLKKENFQSPLENYRQDFLVGGHLYKKGNNVIESSVQYINEPYLNERLTILGSSDDENSFIVFATMWDITKGKNIEMKLTMNSTKNKIQLYIKERPGMHLNSTSFNTFTLPNNITLKKFVELPPIID